MRVGLYLQPFMKHFINGMIMFGLLAATACNNANKPADSAAMAPAPTPVADDITPKYIGFSIVNEYPHDPTAFTEGLEYAGGVFYESTGEYGHSDLRKVDPKTGKVLKSMPLDRKYFGEGLTILGGKIYQLTYRENTGFVYDSATMKLERTFSFGTAEGWGMTNDGKYLIFDDGSNVLHFLDPATMHEAKKLTVADEHGPVQEINELEMVNGFIYANQWKTELILKIDTATGKVVGRADLGSLRRQGGIPPETGVRGAPEVMNGIAYDRAGNRFFITGKYWPKVFEVKLDN